MGLLNKDGLLATTVAGLPTKKVETPELGADTYVIVRGLTGSQRDAYEKACYKTVRGQRVLSDNVRAKLVVRCLVDDAGTLQYADSDVEAIGKLRADVLERIFDACRQMSGMVEGDLDEKKGDSA